MAGESWPICKVEDICAPNKSSLATGPFGSAISSKFFQKSGVPVIRGSNLSQDIGTRLIDEGLVFVSPEKAAEFLRSVARRGDLVFTCWGTIDQVGLIDSRARYDQYIVSNKQMKLTPDSTRADSLFLYYVFASAEMREQIINQGIGSSVPGFNLGQLRNTQFRLPPLAEQKAIAHVLGSLDDKIELNRRMNATLEAMAKALFKSWFVDFDPVKAKAAGCAPEGMNADTAALFPSEFVESESGVIPKGWDKSIIGDQVKVLGGGTPSTKDPLFWDGGSYNWVTPRDLSQLTDRVLLDTERKLTAEGVKQISSGQLPRGTVLLSSRAPIGYLSISQIPISINQGFIAMVCDKQLSPYFVLLWADHSMDAIKLRSSGTTFAEISKANFRPIPVIVPNENVTQQFDNLVAPLYKKIVNNVMQSNSLRQLRDELLPRLISGRIRIT